MSETPPLRSRPSRVCLAMIATTDPTSRPATRSRTNRLRRRSVMGGGGALLRRSQDEQHAAVFIVGGKQVRCRTGGQIALCIYLHGLVEGAHAPFQDRADGIVGVLEAQAEHVADRTADDALVVEPGQLEGAAAAADDTPLGIADEERRVGRRVVVVEQLEQEAEAAARASLRLAAKAGGAVRLGGAVPAI